MAKYLTFSFDDDNISNITIRIEEDLTKNQIDEIEDGMQSLVDQYVSNGEYWDSDEQHIEAYERYYFNEDLRKEYAQKGLERARMFSWTKCVDEMIDFMNNGAGK